MNIAECRLTRRYATCRSVIASVLSAVLLAVGVAGCKSRQPASAPRERYASDGTVSAQLLVRQSTESYALAPGIAYRGGTAEPGNAMPPYPDGLLSMKLPPVTLAVRVVVGTEGKVTDATITDPANPDPVFAAALLAAVSGWRFAPLERISADKVEVLPFSQEYGFTFRQLNGRAVVDAAAMALLVVAAQPASTTMALEKAGEEVLAQVRQQAFKALPREHPSDGVGTAAMQAAAFVGREDLFAKRLHDSLPECAEPQGDPMPTLMKLARRTRIVIINEHHAMPLHREFVARLLKALRPQGYSIYAAETFSMFQSLDHQPVLGSDGWYSNEPIFGRTVQLARKLGYSLAAYEQTPEQAGKQAREQPSRSRDELREGAQAANLMTTIFVPKPKAKVVIHVGHSHVRERKAPWSSKPLVEMAELLKQSTGQDPLTISQLDCRSATAQVVVAGLRMAGEVGSPVDIFIGHPSPVFRDGRPAWRQETGDRAVAVPAVLASGRERIIVEARPAAAGLGTTPVDSVLLYPGERLPLLLPPGRYRIDGFVEGGRVDVAPVVLDVR